MSLIYHYCDVNAFMSIIQNDYLWLSSLYSMNDTAEVEYVRKAAEPVIENVINYNGSDTGLMMTFKANLSALHLYAACFSTEQDDLYQWQAYGQRGKGFAIGFESDLLAQYKPFNSVSISDGTDHAIAPIKTAAIGQSVGVSQVKYMDATQIDAFVQQMAGYLQYGFEHDRDNLVSILLDVVHSISILCAVVKNSKFKAENEHRLLYAADLSYDHTGASIIGDLKERKWRSGAHGITPYFEYKGVKQAIRRVIMGPNCIELNGAHINDFLRSNGLPNGILFKSEATLR